MTQGVPMTQQSNCLLLRMPSDVRESAAAAALHLLKMRQTLQGFGEVAQAEMLPDSQENILQVTFYDVRCAAAAKEAFDDDLVCCFGPPQGRRVLRLGKAGLETANLAEVSNVTCTAEGQFEVEFFDSRAADLMAAGSVPAGEPAEPAAKEAVRTPSKRRTAAVQAMSVDTLPSYVGTGSAGSSSSASGGHPQSVASPHHTRSADPLPRYVRSLRLSQLSWGEFNTGREWRRTLRLCFLPKSLCEPGALEGVLEASGLRDSVERLRVVPGRGGRSLGCAMLRAKTVEAVPALAKLFHGRQYGGSSATPVAVSFAEGQGVRSSGRASTLAQGSTRGKEPLRVKSSLKEPSEPLEPLEAETSETTAADSLSEDSDASAHEDSPTPSKTLPAGFLPPPGLESLCRSACEPAPVVLWQ
eukprot:CAMPEP_0197944248 /NCGR_PEP_ID=MMETSP1439-20131203/125317_1 /TAXON_ID=66791 /ORGANISM="Gonyaulax spinifera, Strain CCMP409" /LENGTH=413 /DNA_ID=CAMNT_0043567505 /DNA_START=43 /DNA_END=1284 /DNA_ORIENTATION=-